MVEFIIYYFTEKTNYFFLHLIFYSLFYLLYNFNYNDKSKINNKKVKNIEYCRKINAYSLSSFSYSLVGIFMLKYNIKLKYYDSFYPIFLIFQGLISFISDSMYMGKSHWIHPIDRSFAKYNLFICILIAKNYNINKIKWCLVGCGILSYKIGLWFLNCNKVYVYCFFHFMWHTIIPLTSIFTMIENM